MTAQIPRPAWRRGSSLHMMWAVVWALLAIPSMLWWYESIRWVIIVSLWANAYTCLSAYEGAKSKEATVDAQD